MASQMSEEISLIIDNEVFRVKRDILCEHSDYFRAMFSGNFSEQGKQEITIDVVDAYSMSIIIKFMTGLIDITEYPLQTVGYLAIAANFLQVTELTKQIETTLETQLSVTNWMDIKSLAENASLKRLEAQAAAFGLYDFRLMKPHFIQSVHKLAWYLSNPHLYAISELDVFIFGFNWMLQEVNSADALLLVLGCLDMSRLTAQELNEIKVLIKDYQNSLLEKVVDFLLKLATDYKISVPIIKEYKQTLCEMYTEIVYVEVLRLVTDSVKRTLNIRPCVAVWSRDPEPDKDNNQCLPHFLYSLQNMMNIEPWLEVVERSLWGWKFVGWGVKKIVFVCGEFGKGTGLFWRGLRVYDALSRVWSDHPVMLPLRRHGAVAIIDDSLYIIGGVGGYRVVLDSAVVYDLKDMTYRKIAKFPDAIQSPAVCVYNQSVYAASHKNVYRYEEYGGQDRWMLVIKTDIRISCMVSYKGYIYCIQSYFNELYRFRPNVDDVLEQVTSFKFSPSTMCLYGDALLAFESTDATQSANITIERYDDGSPEVIYHKENSPIIFNDVAGSCAIVDSMPPLVSELSEYLRYRLANYEACYT